MKADIRIREAVEADAPVILSFIRELAVYERLEHEVVATEADIEKSLFDDSPVAGALIGELDGTPQGFALYFLSFSTFLGRPGIYLEDLFVRESCRGHGLGKALLHHLARLAVDRGYGRVEWAVLDWNSPAIGFYRQLGAVPMDEWTTFRLTGQALVDFAEKSS